MIPVLLITNKTDVTTDFIVRRLKEKNVNFYRFNTEDIGNSVDVIFDFERKIFHLNDRELDIEVDLLKVQAVYFRRPEINNRLEKLSKAEHSFLVGEFSYTLEGIYKILDNAFWLNRVDAIRNAENKIYQLILAERIGLKIPQSLITTEGQYAMAFYDRNDQECIIKPIRSGLVADDEHEEAVIFTNRVYLDNDNIDKVAYCPTFFQKHIRKAGDIRVTVVGDQIFSALIHSQDSDESKVDWRKSQTGLQHNNHILPKDITDKCLRLVESLSLNFGAIDFVLDKDGKYIFLEINPNGQWAWIERLLGLDISDAITNVLLQHINEE